MNSKGSGLLGLIAVVLCIGAAFVLRSIFPALAKLIFWLLGLGVLLILAVVALVMVLAFRKKKGPGEAPAERPEEILSRGRRNVLEIRRRAMGIKDREIGSLCSGICDSADKILGALREQPEEIPEVRKFFNYYLPTLGSLMNTYSRIESSGAAPEEMKLSAISCLQDMNRAMEKQYANLFSDDIFDLTVEMELMTMMCRRDGLIDEGPAASAGGKNVSLTL